MKFPDFLEAEIKTNAETEFNNPTIDFGDRMRDLIYGQTGETLDSETLAELNGWQDVWLEPHFTWGDFIRWVWAVIVAWWKSLWD